MLETQARPYAGTVNNYIDAVKTLENRDHVIITNNGKDEFVLMNMEIFSKFEEVMGRQYIYNELQKSKALPADPNVKLIPHEEVIKSLRAKREARAKI